VALAAAAIIVATPLVHWRRARSGALEPLDVTPAARQLSIRIGDSVHAGAERALGYTGRCGDDRYLHSADDLHVAVRVLALRVDGERASVEFERTDRVTDPSGGRQELRLPPVRKQIERSREGLRFTEQGGPG
jgi:hypothetical protein